MKIRIKGTEKIEELVIRDEKGTEFTNDLLHNYNAVSYNEETEEHEMSQDEFDWWENYITHTIADRREIKETAKALGVEESQIWERINEELEGSWDLGDEHDVIQRVLEEIRKESH
jgi:hypothetical protein